MRSVQNVENCGEGTKFRPNKSYANLASRIKCMKNSGTKVKDNCLKERSSHKEKDKNWAREEGSQGKHCEQKEH